MIKDIGKKKRTAARIQRLIDEVPLCAAAAIQRGPSTAAMLNKRTSQKPMARRSWEVWLEVAVLKGHLSSATLPVAAAARNRQDNKKQSAPANPGALSSSSRL